MAKREQPRFIPPRLGMRDYARVSLVPRWFAREAVTAFGLSPYDIAAFTVIADNLDANGISTTAMTLIADRGGMSEGGAAKAVGRLLAAGIIHELDPRSKGRIMRYGIAAEIPWTGDRR